MEFLDIELQLPQACLRQSAGMVCCRLERSVASHAGCRLSIRERISGLHVRLAPGQVPQRQDRTFKSHCRCSAASPGMQAGRASSTRVHATTDVEATEAEPLVVSTVACHVLWKLWPVVSEEPRQSFRGLDFHGHHRSPFTLQGPRRDGPQKAVPPIDWRMTFALFVFPAIGGLLFGVLPSMHVSPNAGHVGIWAPMSCTACAPAPGYDIGATSGALVSLKSATTSGTSW